jgi:Family of unknown function (DUF5719)
MSTPADGRPSPRGTTRRRAERPSRRPDAGALTAAGLVLLAVVAVLLTRSSEAVPGAGPTQTGAVVSSSVASCPTAQTPAGSSRFTAGVAPGRGLGSSGSVRQGPRTGAGRPLDLQRGQVVRLTGTQSSPVLTGAGGLAAGLFGFRADRSGSLLGAVPCLPPRASWWFSGAGAGLDHASTLVLSNIDPGPAVVDLDVLGPDGPVDTVGTRGITIAPGASKTVKLSDIAPQTDELTLGVEASRGRVVASVSDRFSARPGGEPGWAWLSGDVSPERVVRLAGLPDTASRRTLLVANPSDNEAVVDVQVAGSSGSFVPAGAEQQTVAPGSVESIELPREVDRKEAVAVRLASQVPVLATVRSISAGDTSYAAPVVPLTGAAAAPVLPKVTSTVQLTAGATKASADVVAYDERGRRVDGHDVTVPAKATVGWSPKRGAVYVVVTPTAGHVYGAAVYQGKGVEAYPLTALPIRFVQPAVTPAVR